MIRTNFVLTGRGGIDFAINIEVPTASELLTELGVLQLSLFQAGDTPSATITPEKQQAARDSTAAGKVEKAAKAEKAAAEKPKDTPKAEPEKPARTYETSGIAPKVAKAVAKDRDAVVALLTKYKAVGPAPESKLSAKFLPVESFDEFEANIDGLLASAEDLG